MKTSNNDINRQIQIISSLIGDGKYKYALDLLKDLENHNLNNSFLQFNKVGLLIDIGSGLKDEEIIKVAINEGENNLPRIIEKEYRATIYYNLANGYLSLFNLFGRKDIYAFIKSDELQKAKLNFRKSIKNFNSCDNNLRKQILVNYGNCLDTIGRTLEALYSYYNALKIDKNFSIAIGNKALALAFFADISKEYRAAIYIEAYQEIKSIINNKDLIFFGGVSVKKTLQNEMKKIESMFNDKKILETRLEHPEYNKSKLTKFEKFYIDFCINKKLFLNFHIHNDNCEASIIDPVFISLITDINDNETFYRLAKHINQIKEDYAVARLLLVQSQYRRKDFDNISKRTTLVNTLDYSQFNLYIGLLKSAFKEAYNILDKIAFFINDYLRLRLRERSIYFDTIWEKENELKSEILESKNISLYALYDIHRDFKLGFFQKIKDVRNALTHRKLVVYDSILTGWDKKDDKINIGYETFLKETINLFQLVKSAIVYLVNFVNIEENKKKKDGLVIPMLTNNTQFF